MALLEGRWSSRICLPAIGLLVSVLLISLPVHAQVAGATLSGVVSDASGSVIPNAKVSIKDTDTGIVRDVDVNPTGFYTAPNLQPGAYEVTISADGFSTRVQSGITLTVGGEQTLNVTLQVGSVNQRVEITAEAPTVELTSSSISEEVEGNTIRELPLNGRDWTSLAALQPGVLSMSSIQLSYTGGNGQNRANRGYGAQMAIGGARPYANNYRVDGITINDYANNAPGNALGISLGVDAIEEFSVVTNNYSAAYGRTSGGVVNAITRSGTNQFHGSVYEFIRNSALDARNFFDPPTIPPFRRNQFGASGGAPIKKDKSFIFADYEGLRQFLGVTTLDTTPSAAARAGNLCSIPTGVTPNCTSSTITVSPAVLPYLGFWPLPNDGLLGNGDTGTDEFVSNQIISANYVIVRFDHHFSDKDSFFASFLRDTSLYTQPDSINAVELEQSTANQRISLEETHIFGSKLVNSARFGFNRVYDIGGGAIGAINPLASETSLGIVNIGGIQYDSPGISASGITSFTGGVVGQSQVRFTWNSFQGYDDATYTFGKHSIQFGGGVERDQLNKMMLTNPNGGFTYGSLTAFLTNAAPTQFSVGLADPSAGRYFRVSVFGAYVQDDVRVRKNFTLDLGVRYETMPTPTETLNRWANLVSPTDLAPRLGNPFYYNPTKLDFAPRIGFAWDPFGDGKTSIRSGFGIFDVQNLPYQWSTVQPQSYPYTVWLKDSKVTSSAGSPAFPTGALTQTLAVGPAVEDFVEQHPKRSYMMQWNLSVQRQLLPSLTVMAAYVGSRGVHLPFYDYDVDMVEPTLTSAGYLWPNPIGSGTRLNTNPGFGQVYYQVWDRTSTYNGLETQVSKQFSHGFQLQGSFTWSASYDDSSSGSVANALTNSLTNLFTFINNRSLADFNIKDNLLINGTYTVPSPKLSNRFANTALGGWELGGLLTARTGVPFSIGIGGDALGTLDASPADFPDFLKSSPGCSNGVTPGNVINYVNVSCFSLPMSTPAIASQCVAFKGIAGSCENLLGNSGRNPLTGPGMVDLDFSVIKNNRITERLNAQFRAEFFNIFNRANFNIPVTSADGVDIFNASGASVGGAANITTTSTTSRQVQFAIKMIW